MQHLAIDLGGQESQICIREQDGAIRSERKIRTPQIRSFLKHQPKSRVILETCAEAFRIADGAREAGHDVRVVPATLVRQLGVGQRGIKTDRRDAQVLSEVSCRIDLPSVHVRSERARNWKSISAARLAMVEARTQLTNSVRGWLRTQILSIRRGSPATFPERVRAKLLDRPEGLPAFIERQLSVIEELNKQIKEADREIENLVKHDPICSLLMTAPCVGPLTAMQYCATVDDVTRFPNAHSIESFFGLTPGERSSSLKKRRTGITKAGPPEMRRLLNQVCWCISRQRVKSPLAIWGHQIAERRGKFIANVAMSRKLVGILYAMWRDATPYDASKVSRLVSGCWEVNRSS